MVQWGRQLQRQAWPTGGPPAARQKPALQQVKPGAQINMANRQRAADHGNVPALNSALLKAQKEHV